MVRIERGLEAWPIKYAGIVSFVCSMWLIDVGREEE